MKRTLPYLLFILFSATIFATEIVKEDGLPRIFIDTKNKVSIDSREKEIPGTMTWQENAAEKEREPLAITVRCRGNSSFNDMPKHSYRVHGEKKFSPPGMAPHRDWALVTNYADRSMIRNRITYTLARELGADFAPRTLDVELFINGKYEGVYLLVETPKVSEKRINIKASEYLVEVDNKYHPKDVVVFDREKRPFNIKYPKHPDEKQIAGVKKRIENFEAYLYNEFPSESTLENLSQQMDLEDYFRFYWIQEVSKNPDLFLSSTYFTLRDDGKIHMGPIWDFDAAYGIYPKKTIPMEWHARKRGWNKRLFMNTAFKAAAREYWNNHHKVFESMLDSMEVFARQLTPAAENNYRRWDILQDTTNRFHHKKYGNYGETVLSLKTWYRQRMEWIDKALDKE